MATAQKNKPIMRFLLHSPIASLLIPSVPFTPSFFAKEARELPAYLRGDLQVCLLGGIESLTAMRLALQDGFACVALARPLLREPTFLQV